MVKHVHFHHTPIHKWSALRNYYDPNNEALAACLWADHKKVCVLPRSPWIYRIYFVSLLYYNSFTIIVSIL